MKYAVIQKDSAKAHERLLAQAKEFYADAPEHLAMLKNILMQYDVNPTLQKICLGAARLPIDKTLSDLNDQQLVYSLELTRSLLSLNSAQASADEIEKLLHGELFRLNYNKKEYIDYYIGSISKQIKDLESLHDQLLELYRWQKVVLQYPECLSFVYDQRLKSCKRQVLDWLSCEISYAEMLTTFEPVATYNEGGDLRLRFNLSVAELAYFLRLLSEEGVLQGSLHEVATFFTQHATTKQRSILSIRSLKNKYHNTEDATRHAVKMALVNMIQKIK